MDSTDTTNLFEDLSDASTEDTYLLYKNEQNIPDLPLQVFRKPKKNVFDRRPSLVPRIRESELLKCVDGTKKAVFVSSTPMHSDDNTKSITSSLCLSPINFSGDNINGSGSKQTYKVQNPSNKLAIDLQAHKNDILNWTKNNEHYLEDIEELNGSSEIPINKNKKITVKNQINFLEQQTQTTDSLNYLQPDFQRAENIECNNSLIPSLNNDVIIDKCLQNFNTTEIPQFTRVISISSECSSLNTFNNQNSTGTKRKLPIQHNSDKENLIQPKSHLKTVDVSSNISVAKVVTKNQNHKLNSSHTLMQNSKEVVKKGVESENLNDTEHTIQDVTKSAIQNQKKTPPKSLKPNNPKVHKTKSSVAKTTSDDTDGNFVDVQKRASKSRSASSKTSKIVPVRKSTKSRRSSKRKTINLQQYVVCRKSGFVEVCQNDTNDSEEDSSADRKSKRKCKPPKAYIQATLFGGTTRTRNSKSNFTNTITQNKRSTKSTIRTSSVNDLTENKQAIPDTLDQNKCIMATKKSSVEIPQSSGLIKSKTSTSTTTNQIKSTETIKKRKTKSQFQSKLMKKNSEVNENEITKGPLTENQLQVEPSNGDLIENINITDQTEDFIDSNKKLLKNDIQSELPQSSDLNKNLQHSLNQTIGSNVSTPTNQAQSETRQNYNNIDNTPSTSGALPKSPNLTATNKYIFKKPLLSSIKTFNKDHLKDSKTTIKNGDKAVQQCKTTYNPQTQESNVANLQCNNKEEMSLLNVAICENGKFETNTSERTEETPSLQINVQSTNKDFANIEKQETANVLIHQQEQILNQTESTSTSSSKCTKHEQPRNRLLKVPNVDNDMLDDLHNLETSDISNVIYTIIDNKTVPVNWCSDPPSLDLESDEKIKVIYTLKNLKTHYSLNTFGFIIFAPCERRVQNSLHHTITYKVEKGQAKVCIELHEKVFNVNSMFYIPIGSTYAISNMSHNEPLVLFFARITHTSK